MSPSQQKRKKIRSLTSKDLTKVGLVLLLVVGTIASMVLVATNGDIRQQAQTGYSTCPPGSHLLAGGQVCMCPGNIAVQLGTLSCPPPPDPTVTLNPTIKALLTNAPPTRTPTPVPCPAGMVFYQLPSGERVCVPAQYATVTLNPTIAVLATQAALKCPSGSVKINDQTCRCPSGVVVAIGTSVCPGR